MKLTKLQRYTAYCIMLAEAEDIEYDKYGRAAICDPWGFCEMVQDLRIKLSNLTELVAKKPEKMYGEYWFDYYRKGWRQRIKLLKQCIAETA